MQTDIDSMQNLWLQNLFPCVGQTTIIFVTRRTISFCLTLITNYVIVLFYVISLLQISEICLTVRYISSSHRPHILSRLKCGGFDPTHHFFVFLFWYPLCFVYHPFSARTWVWICHLQLHYFDGFVRTRNNTKQFRDLCCSRFLWSYVAIIMKTY